MTNWYAVIVPVVLSGLVAGLLALIPVLFRLSNRLALQEREQALHGKEIEEMKKKLDAHEAVLIDQKVVLGRVETKLDMMLEGFSDILQMRGLKRDPRP